MPPSQEAAERPANPLVLLACSDLMFVVRVQAMARAAGCELRAVRRGEPLPQADLLVVNVGDRTGWSDTIREAAAAGTPVIGFGPHSDADARAAAKEAGAGRVLSNGNLGRDLPPVLAGLRAGSAAD